MAAQGDMRSSARFRVGVYGVIERDGRFLLARRSDIGWWNLPGGGLEHGETPEEGLTREVREEIAASVSVGRLVGVYAKPQKDEIVLVYLCQLTPDSPPPGTSDEVSEVAWVTPDALPENTLPKHAERLRDAAAGQAAPFLRAQRTSTTEDQRLR
jgi:8-oxo-dGTP diphosphatase